MAVPLDGAVGPGGAVVFVKEKGGMGADNPDDNVRSSVLEAEPLAAEDTVPVVMVPEIGPVPVVVAGPTVELGFDVPLDWPDAPLDETVGPKLPVEFDSGNGGVEITDWETDEISEPALGPVVNGVTGSGEDALEDPTGTGEPVDGFAVPVGVMPDGSVVPLGIFVEFGMGNGTDVKLPGGTVEFVNGPVGPGVELKDIGPGPVGTRLPVDPDIVGAVALDNGKGAEELLALDIPVAPLEWILVGPENGNVEFDRGKGTEVVGVTGLPLELMGCPVGPVTSEVELVMGNGAV
ncbi:hypothetical protein Hte_012239 [Hypoxylon texense]